MSYIYYAISVIWQNLEMRKKYNTKNLVFKSDLENEAN